MRWSETLWSDLQDSRSLPEHKLPFGHGLDLDVGALHVQSCWSLVEGEAIGTFELPAFKAHVSTMDIHSVTAWRLAGGLRLDECRLALVYKELFFSRLRLQALQQILRLLHDGLLALIDEEVLVSESLLSRLNTSCLFEHSWFELRTGRLRPVEIDLPSTAPLIDILGAWCAESLALCCGDLPSWTRACWF